MTARDRLVPLLAGIGRDPDDRSAVARIVLGAIAEPGDGVLGRIVAAVGARRAAGLLVAPAGASEIAGSLASALAEAGDPVDPRTLRAGLARWLPRLDVESIARGAAQAARVGATLLLPGDESWPVALDDLGPHAPVALWVRGDPSLLADGGRSVSLVGARAATSYGEHVTAELAAGLSDRGFAIVSGGAYGIDGMAHRATLASGGTTVAFLAGGVDRFYPAGHESLLTRIAETGAVVSEVPCGQAPTKWRFLQRNRLIAAATAATVVVEAGWRSGSLNTAGHASALARPLGAVPGPVTSPASAGCHRLLREYDAVCVTDADQVVELVGGSPAELPGGAGAGAGGGAGAGRDAFPNRGGPSASQSASIDTDDPPEVIRLVDALGVRAARTVEELVVRSGLDGRRVMGLLGVLEAEGRAARGADGWLLVRRSA